MTIRTDLDALADEIFAEAPSYSTTSPRPYLHSDGYHARRVLLPGFEESLAQSYSDCDLSAFFRPLSALGPYERHVLGHLFFAPSTLVCIVGSTGSGKSSSIRYALQSLDGALLASSDDDAATKYGLSAFVQLRMPSHVYLDLNMIHEDMLATERRSNQVALEEAFERKFANELPSAILRFLDTQDDAARAPAAALFDLLWTTLDWSLGRRPVPKVAAFRSGRLATIVAPAVAEVLDANRSTPEACMGAVLRVLASFPPRSQIDFWIAVLDVASHIQRLIRPLPTEAVARLFLVVDNVDPLPESIQHLLREMLLKYVHAVDIKIVVPARHSTFRVVSYAKQFNWYPHCGPDPREIVINRLIDFVSHPHLYRSYTSMVDRRSKDAAICRSLETIYLLRRGSPQRPTFGDLLSHASGDSIRRALAAMRAVYLSPDLNFSYEARAVLPAYEQLLRVFAAENVLERMAQAFGDECAAMVDEVSDANLEPNQQGRTVERGAARLARSLQAAIEGAIRASATSALQLSADDRETASSLLREAADRLSTTIHEAIVFSRELLLRRGATPDKASTLPVNVLRALQGRLETVTSAFADHAVLRRYVHDSIRDGLASAAADPAALMLPDLEDDEPTDDRFASSRVQEALKRLSLANGRSAFVRAFTASPQCADLFRVGRGLSPLKLRMVATVHSAGRDGLRLGTLLERLKLLGFVDEERWLIALNELCSASSRVLWASKHFHYESLDALKRDEGLHSQVTRGGVMYFDTLLANVDYICAKLAPGTAGAPFSARVATALSSLRDLHDLELSTFKQRRAAIQANHEREQLDQDWLHAGCLSLDVACRSTPSLLRALRSSAVRARRSSRDRVEHFVELRSVAYRWLGFLETGFAEYGVLTKIAPNIVAYATPLVNARSLDPYFRWPEQLTARHTAGDAMRRIQSALEGDELWVEGVPIDEYAPRRPR